MPGLLNNTWCWALLGALVCSINAASAGEVTILGSRWTGEASYSGLADRAFSSPASSKTTEGAIGQASVEGGSSAAISDQSLPYGTEPPGTAVSAKSVPVQGLFAPWFRWQGSPYRAWTLDYRCRCMTASNTASEFGTPDPPPVGWSPEGRSDFALNSLWHGLHAGVEQPNWGAQFEWMMPQQGIQGNLADYGWNPPNSDGSYTDLDFMNERWSGSWGQMMDLGMQFRLVDHIFKAPIEIWPIAGFRWQRFEITCKNLVQIKDNNIWNDPPLTTSGDILNFNQEYYIGYLGAQARSHIGAALVTVQGDWGATWAYNVNRSLLGNRFLSTMDSTQGDSWHLGITTEVPLNQQVSLGFQYDHLSISTVGSHHLQNLPAGQDLTWNNGVRVFSNQNWITGFVRFRF